MFLGLAIICDDYFCESLDAISEALNLSEDVAGATFMAAGSSAPELFTAIVTILITGGSEGLGTIVGSAIFNIMIIVGVTAIFAGQKLKVWWYPLCRDCLVYFLSIGLMVWAIFDKKVSWCCLVVVVVACHNTTRTITDCCVCLRSHTCVARSGALVEVTGAHPVLLWLHCHHGLQLQARGQGRAARKVVG